MLFFGLKVQAMNTVTMSQTLIQVTEWLRGIRGREILNRIFAIFCALQKTKYFNFCVFNDGRF